MLLSHQPNHRELRKPSQSESDAKRSTPNRATLRRRSPMSYTPLVVDLSHWNSGINFATLRQSGIVGCIHKATEGTSYVDADYASRKTSAKSAGVLWASYHFLKHGHHSEQAQWYIQHSQPDTEELAVADFEDSGTNLTDLTEFLRAVRALRPDLRLVVYSGHLIKESLGDEQDDFLSTTDLWLAQYTTGEISWPS